MTQLLIHTSTSDHLIYQEAMLAEINLQVGFSNLVEVIPYTPLESKLYASLFNLTIGVERFLKVALIIIRLSSEEELPSNSEMQDYGHKLVSLYDKVISELSDQFKHAFHVKPMDQNHANIRLFQLLSSFASHDRYFNITSLCNGSHDLSKEPLIKWLKLSESYFLSTNISDSDREHIRYLKKNFKDDSIFKGLDGQKIKNSKVYIAQYKFKKTTSLIIKNIKDLLFPILVYIDFLYMHNEGNKNPLKPNFRFGNIFTSLDYSIERRTSLYNKMYVLFDM